MIKSLVIHIVVVIAVVVGISAGRVWVHAHVVAGVVLVARDLN